MGIYKLQKFDYYLINIFIYIFFIIKINELIYIINTIINGLIIT